MNKIKFNRLISFVVALIMLVISLPSVLAENIEIQSFGLDDKYIESFGLLKTIGVYNEEYINGINENSIISRGEFVKRLLMTMNLADSASVLCDRITFMDIYDKEMSGYANLAYDMGITMGTGYAMFEPDENITVETAIVMVMRALGYTYITSSYELQLRASIIGVSEGVKSTDYLTEADASLILYNALHADSLQASTYGGTTQGLVAGSNWLDIWFDIGYVEGVVVATELTGIKLNGATAQNRIRIGNKEICGVPQETEELLGYQVRCYYKQSDTEEFVYITKYGFNYNEITLKAKDVNNFTASDISYYNDKDRVHNIKLSSSADFIYNGKVVSLSEHSIDELKADYTGIKLLDNDYDNKYDVVFVTKSRSFAVDSVDYLRMRISGKDSQMVSLKKDGDFICRIKSADGSALKLEDIKAWNVVTVTESFDNSFTVIVVSDETLTGTVRSVTTTDETLVDVDGQMFEISQHLINNNSVKAGVPATFYLSAENVICEIRYESEIKGSWAYAVGLKSTNSLGGNFKIGCVIGYDPEYKVFETADKVIVDGLSVREDILDSVLTADKFPEVMILEFNDNDEVTTINTLAKGADESEEENIVKRYEGKNKPEIFYSNWGMSFNAQFLLSGTATMYALPDVETNYDDVFVPYFQHSETYDVDLYSVGVKSPVCQMVVARGMALSGAAMSVETGFYPFLNVIKEWDEVEEETIDVMYYLDNSNKQVGIKIPESIKNVVVDTVANKTVQNIIDSLEKGDLIRFEKNSLGLANIQHIFDVSEKKLIAETKEFKGNFAPRFVAGQLYEAKDNYARIIVNSSYDPVAGTGIETHPRNADNRTGTIVTVGKNGNISVSTVASSVSIPGVNQGENDIYAVFQTRYGNPIFMTYIDYSNLSN